MKADARERRDHSRYTAWRAEDRLDEGRPSRVSRSAGKSMLIMNLIGLDEVRR
jgi:hypothetical protein